MRRDPRKFLKDIQDACRFIQGIVSKYTLDQYLLDRMIQSATERELQVIGEAVFQLSRIAKPIVVRITEHERIIRFRHILVHAYDMVDDRMVWSIIQAKIPTLLEEANRLLLEEPHEEMTSNMQDTPYTRRCWLTFPTRDQVEQPIIWQMGRKYPDVVYDIRQASVRIDIGIMAVLLSGREDQVKGAIEFLRSKGVGVEPIEKNIIEG
jgi:uncharacterized protein with HEPN domain